jgi:hypothetical protein
LKITILLLACLFLAALCINAVATEAASSQLTALREDSGKDYSEMNFTYFSTLDEFGVDGLGIGEAVKFTTPKDGWKLQKVRIVGWSGYNESTQLFPADKNIMLEIRDKDLNILYKFADAQNNYFLSETGPLFGEIEIPAVPVTREFYVVFYDRGAARIAMESNDGTGSSFLFIGDRIQPAEFSSRETNETVKINWLIEAEGK